MGPGAAVLEGAQPGLRVSGRICGRSEPARREALVAAETRGACASCPVLQRAHPGAGAFAPLAGAGAAVLEAAQPGLRVSGRVCGRSEPARREALVAADTRGACASRPARQRAHPGAAAFAPLAGVGAAVLEAARHGLRVSGRVCGRSEPARREALVTADTRGACASRPVRQRAHPGAGAFAPLAGVGAAVLEAAQPGLRVSGRVCGRSEPARREALVAADTRGACASRPVRQRAHPGAGPSPTARSRSRADSLNGKRSRTRSTVRAVTAGDHRQTPHRATRPTPATGGRRRPVDGSRTRVTRPRTLDASPGQPNSCSTRRPPVAGVRGGRTHPGLRRSPTTVLKTAGATGHHPLPR